MATVGLDMVEKTDRFVEEPEGPKARSCEQRNHQERVHGRILGEVARSPLPFRAQLRSPLA
jgi:hypothetical protein